MFSYRIRIDISKAETNFPVLLYKKEYVNYVLILFVNKHMMYAFRMQKMALEMVLQSM